ncbi:response regulator [Gayadomonas joobiniege]|uniref:response regulator n=1 Tax=Gayadomonas joobiniege TaxID=1234606 RepID=UPI00035C4127|nr:response regulator [Gayadomonas joobiniege]
MDDSAFSDTRILIVDDQPLAQIYLKHALESINIRNIQVAEHADRALEFCQNNHYTLIICAFNQSKQKDGFHFFEELKLKKQLPLTTAFIFTSAETDSALVNSVIELQPDDFIAKPFNVKEVCERVQRVLKHKQHLFAVYSALEKQQYTEALAAVEKVLLKPSMSLSFPIAMRLKGDLLLIIKAYQEAANYFTDIVHVQKFTWAMVGLAKAYLGLNKESTALKILSKLTLKPDTQLAALDLLGNYYLQQDKYDQAIENLKHARDLSPRNIERQKNVVGLARLLHDHELQFESAKNMLRYAKRSLHDTPDLYLTVARAAVDYALIQPDIESMELCKQSEKYLQTVRQKFPSDPATKEKIGVLEARILYLKDEQEKAKKLLTELPGEMENLALEDGLDKAKVFHELGLRDEAVELLKQLQQKQPSDQSLDASQKILTDYLSQELKEKTEIPFTPKEINNIAVKLFKSRQYVASVQAFSDALRLMPKNTRIALNLLQALVETSQQQALNSEQLKQYQNSLQVLQTIQLDEQQTIRYEALLKRYKKSFSQKTNATASSD